MKKVMKYRKKPVVIEAIQFDGFNFVDVLGFISDPENVITHDDSIIIKTLEGNMVASVGDYIIKGVKGEFYPCKPDIFVNTYDLVL